MKSNLKLCWVMLISLFLSTQAFAKNVVVNLDVAYKKVNFTGKWTRAIAINGQIPGPTLHFKEGDHVTINVYNHLKRVTSMHWHGIIVPWRMDGVSYVSQKPTPPGGVYHYIFTLHQFGTYWYHSHYDLQEQDGMYGAIIIDPKHKKIKSNKDFVMVLSDWINMPGQQVFDDLKKSSDYYEVQFPLQTSLVDFLHSYNHSDRQQRKKLVHAYMKMQTTRLDLYPYSDVAYDTFLLNGHPPTRPWIRHVKVGDVVRLRFIGAGAGTFFRIKIPGAKLKIVTVDGNYVKPLIVNSIKIGPGETYNVLVKIKQKRPYIVYAESLDKVGAAYGVLLTAPHQHFSLASVKPFPNPPMRYMKKIKTAKQTVTKYQHLQSPTKTNNPDQPVHVINMALTGNMYRYIWSINGKTGYKAKPVKLHPGWRYRIIFVNKTLMSHPMHIHGHWFILRNGHGAHDPLLHTVNVKPLSTVVTDFVANENGQWFFHCHNLYHLEAGMFRILRYPSMEQMFIDQGGIPNYLEGPKLGWFYMLNLQLLQAVNKNVTQGTLNYMMGTTNNKLQLFSYEAEIDDGVVDNFDLDIFYWHAIGRYWAIKGGANYVYRPADKPYWQPGIGIEGVAPFFIDTNLRIYNHAGSTKFDLIFGRETWIYKRLFLSSELRFVSATKTIARDMIGNGLNFIEFDIGPQIIIAPYFSVQAQYEYTRFYGSRARLLRDENEATSDNLIFLGFNLLV